LHQCKNFENRLRFDKVTESLQVGPFFETQCRSVIFNEPRWTSVMGFYALQYDYEQITTEGSVQLLIDSVVSRDELVHDERHGLLHGRRLLDFAAVSVSEIDNAPSAWTEVAHDSRRRHQDYQEDQYA